MERSTKPECAGVGRRMRLHDWVLLGLAWAAGIVGSGTGVARGNGFEVPDQSAAATGQAQAFAAQADDPSAIYFNPAGLTQLRGTQLSLGAYGFVPNFRFEGPGGRAQTTASAYVPHFFVTTDFGLERWRFGLGLGNTFGLAEKWGRHSPVRFVVTDARLSVTEISPTLSYQLTDKLSVGGGPRFYYGELLNERATPLPPPLPAEGQAHFRGDGWAVSGSAALLYKIDARNTFGVVYRSPFSLDFDGKSRIETPAPRPPAFGPSPAHARIHFPQNVTAGYAFRPVKPLKLEADVGWTDWENLDRVVGRSPNALFNNQVTRFDWKASLTFRLGLQYDLNENWTLRAGYGHGDNAVPNRTFGPLVPDANIHEYTAGVGYSRPRWKIDAAYQYVRRDDRNIVGRVDTSPFVNGKWRNESQSVSLTLTLKL